MMKLCERCKYSYAEDAGLCWGCGSAMKSMLNSVGIYTFPNDGNYTEKINNPETDVANCHLKAKKKDLYLSPFSNKWV